MADQQTIEQRAAEREARKKKNANARRAYRAKQKAKRAEARGSAGAPAEAMRLAGHKLPVRTKFVAREEG